MKNDSLRVVTNYCSRFLNLMKASIFNYCQHLHFQPDESEMLAVVIVLVVFYLLCCISNPFLGFRNTGESRKLSTTHQRMLDVCQNDESDGGQTIWIDFTVIEFLGSLIIIVLSGYIASHVSNYIFDIQHLYYVHMHIHRYERYGTT